jgi:1,2-diacylglycerol 3-alpha-glucosyltransferase
MRIGLFTNNYRPLANGLVTSIDTFTQAFRRVGHQVTIVAPRYHNKPSDPDTVLRVPGFRAPTHHAYVLPIPWWPGIRQTVANLDLDVYHAQHPFLLGAAAARWAHRANRPLVFTYHTRYDRYAHYVPGPSRIVATMALRRALAFAQRADLVIAPTPSVARDLCRLGVRTPIEIVPTGVTLPTTDGTDRRTSRRLLGLDDGNPLCLSVGRLATEKNLAFLLHGFHHIVRALPAARLVLVGDGDERLALERLARDLGVRPSVRFVGAVPRERVGEYTRAADLFLFPSKSETQGLAALEALAAALPVVAVASEAATDLLQGESAGVLCPEDPKAFAETVTTLWAAPDRRLAMADAGRRLAAQFTPEASAATLLGLYAELLRGWRLAPAAARADALRSGEA